MKINEVIDSSKLEDIVVDAIKNTVTDITEYYQTRDLSKTGFPLFLTHVKDKFVVEYRKVIISRCFKDVDLTRIKFNIGILDSNHLWYKIKEITNNHLLMHIRLDIDAELFNQVMLSLSAYLFNSRAYEIDYLIENSLKILNFIEIQVHELTHLEQLLNRLKNKKGNLEHIKDLVILNNKKVNKVRNINSLPSRHFVYPNEMNAYASEISSYIISSYKKELKDSVKLFDGLPKDYFAKHLQELKQTTLSKIPSLAKHRRWEINDYTKEKIYSTLLKQIYINLERKISDLEEQALENFKEGQYENK